MAKANIWIFCIEPIDTRYTGQWYKYLPLELKKSLNTYNVKQIDGIQNNTEVTPGAFLNFSDTNYWKSSQLCEFLNQFNAGKVTKDDHLLFTDAWNPTIIQVRYMKDLMGFNWTLHGLWHAGSYDPQDFLGRAAGNKAWANCTEQSLYYSLDYNYFATDFHKRLFIENVLHENPYRYCMLNPESDQCRVVGWPMDYLTAELRKYTNLPKENLILFPHRLSPEKQVEIFEDLAKERPQYEWVIAQNKKLTKHEYHTLLGKAKIIFSANLQETLGISTCAEGPICNAIPLAPNRLSYTEIFSDGFEQFLYKPEWTSSWTNYLKNKQKVLNLIDSTIENYDSLKKDVKLYVVKRIPKYFSSEALIRKIGNIV